MTKIIFFGTPQYVVCIPKDLQDAGCEIVAVVTPEPKPSGRDMKIVPSPVETWAKERNIRVFYNPQEIQSTEADLGIVASYGKIITKEVLDLFTKGLLNVHPSLLPKYRGASPIPAAILNGDSETGVTIIKMDEQMDHGPILKQSKFKIGAKETTEDLLKVAFQLGAKMLVDVVPDYLTDKASPCQQDHTKVTFTWKTNETKDKAYFDLENPPTLEVIDRMSRAFYPWPNAWTLWKRHAISNKQQVVKFLPNKMVQLEGKKPVTYKQLKEGYPEFPLELA